MASGRVAPLVVGVVSSVLLAGSFLGEVVPDSGASSAAGIGPGTFARFSLALITLLSLVTLVRSTVREKRSAGSDVTGEPRAWIRSAVLPWLLNTLVVVAVAATSVLFGWFMVEISVVLGVALLCTSWLLINHERRWLRFVAVLVASAGASCALVVVTGAYVERLVF